MHTLFTWLGNRDIENMEADKSAAIVAMATKSQPPFDKIVILSNNREDLSQQKWREFEHFIKKRMLTINRPSNDINVHLAKIDSPIDYQSIAVETEKWINKLSEEASLLSINLTSGTPAMTTLAVLLGKSKTNTQFLQTTPKNELQIIDIPIDFSQQYTKSVEKNIAYTATSEPKSPNQAFSELTVKSKAMKQVAHKAQRIAVSEVPALILGETGTGKELMANAIHKASLRANKPIRIVNCGALAENIVDSTLFGHKKGAYTGATQDHAGLFEQADGGTLFLDEVGELKPDIQVKLLRALQQGEITRLGDTQTIQVDVRIIAATHQNLSQLVEQGLFREDLFYRLAVGIIKIPALRQRAEDLPLITEQFTQLINQVGSKHPDYISKKISDNGMKFISEQSWHGNIRELWSTLNRAFLWSDRDTITEIELADSMITRTKKNEVENITLSYGDKVDIVQLTDNFQKKYVSAALEASGHVKKHATQMLGLKDHQTLTNWMKRLGIQAEK